MALLCPALPFTDIIPSQPREVNVVYADWTEAKQLFFSSSFYCVRFRHFASAALNSFGHYTYKLHI